ncbi:MAG: hypothetical protein ACRYF4_10035 [Janthinobacterium lividum]
MTTIVLLCAVLASLAGGVLLAYVLCDAMFGLFRIHSIQAAQQRIAKREAQVVPVSQLEIVS